MGLGAPVPVQPTMARTAVQPQPIPSPRIGGPPASPVSPPASRATGQPTHDVTRPATAMQIPAPANDFSNKLSALGLTREQVEGVLALSREVVEQVVWEVVPELAEQLIREEIRRLTAE